MVFEYLRKNRLDGYYLLGDIIKGLWEEHGYCFQPSRVGQILNSMGFGKLSRSYKSGRQGTYYVIRDRRGDVERERDNQEVDKVDQEC